MKKTDIKTKAITFNVTYTDISAGVKLLKNQIKQNISFAKKLIKKADKLSHYGHMKCYTFDDKNNICPIKGINNMEYKMARLEYLRDNVNDLEDLVNTAFTWE